MAFIHIKNQPIQFEDDTDDVNITFEQEYRQLMQAGDRLYFQMRQDPCGADLLCGIKDTLLTLVLNGTFTGSATSWGLGTGWTYGANLVSKAAGNTNPLFQSAMPFVSGQSYSITYTLVRTAGTIYVQVGDGAGATVGTTRNSSGTYTETLLFSDTADKIIQFIPNAAFIGSIDDVIVVNSVSSCLSYNPRIWTYATTSITHVVQSYSLTRDYITISPALLTINKLYKVTITITNATAGSLLVTIGDYTETLSTNGVNEVYGNSGATTALTFGASYDFNGTITGLTAFVMNMDHTITVINSDDVAMSTPYSLTTATDPIQYYRDYISWSVILSNILNPGLVDIQLPNGCYRLKLFNNCDSTTSIQHNSISYKANGSFENSKLIKGTCGGFGYGFLFENGATPFFLSLRVRMTWFAPRYPTEGTEYFYSTGEKVKLFTKREKIRTLMFDYVDENTHDVISLLINCDTFTIDAVEYYAPIKDYAPEWDPNGRRSLAQSRIDMSYKTDVLFNRSE